MTGEAIAINDASATDTILSVKKKVFATNRKMFVRRQRLVNSTGPFGLDALAAVTMRRWAVREWRKTRRLASMFCSRI